MKEARETERETTEKRPKPCARFDGVSGCKECDRVNLSNAVHAVIQLASCENSEPRAIDDAVIIIEEEARKVLERRANE